MLQEMMDHRRHLRWHCRMSSLIYHAPQTKVQQCVELTLYIIENESLYQSFNFEEGKFLWDLHIHGQLYIQLKK